MEQLRKKINKYWRKLCHDLEQQLYYFHTIWILILLLPILAWCSKDGVWFDILTYSFLVLFVVGLIVYPMKVIYGLMGTRKSLRVFLVNFIIINILLSVFYYCGFFKESGITYDHNQPFIDFSRFNKEGKFADKDTAVLRFYENDTILACKMVDSTLIWDTLVKVKEKEVYNFQKISCWEVLGNAFLTSIIQDTPDLFSAAYTYNESMGMKVFREEEKNKENRKFSQFFRYIFLLQIIISWLFLGVFIALLYDKFKYDG